MSTLSVETAKRRRGVRGFLARAWQAAMRPAARIPVVVLLLLGGVGGVLFWGGFNWAMELTNTEAFCVSCHEMRNTVFVEYKETPHYNNPSGVRASCPDCHVPDPWVDKVVRKVKATNELWHKLAGTIATPADFEAHRLGLAQSVWATMKATDSRECRNCHAFAAMSLEGQVRPAQRKHRTAIEKGETCIDCHKGIAHKLPAGWDAAVAAK